jgi:hypothetical protein
LRRGGKRQQQRGQGRRHERGTLHDFPPRNFSIRRRRRAASRPC